MIKSMFGALALFIFLLAPVSGQVDITVYEEPGDYVADREIELWNALSAASRAVADTDSKYCQVQVYGEPDGEHLGKQAWVCVFPDPETGVQHLLALSGPGKFDDAIILLYGGEFIAAALSEAADVGSSLLHINLDEGEYEVVFTGYPYNVEERISFVFWIEDSEEG